MKQIQDDPTTALSPEDEKLLYPNIARVVDEIWNELYDYERDSRQRKGTICRT